MKIYKPIFILGSGRSGTTIMYHLLAVHPQVCWFSNRMNAQPQRLSLAYLHRIIDLPVLGECIKRSILAQSENPLLYPSEGENIYTYFGFRDDMQSVSTDKISKKSFQTYISRLVAASGNRRFLSKRTANTQRLRLINKIFPNAVYIHVIRDGRAVSTSLHYSSWWKTVPIWWLRGKTPLDWEHEGRDPLELCALHWQHNVEEIRKQSRYLSGRYMEIRYETLVTDVKQSIRRILRFCELEQTTAYMEILPESLPNMNEKWKVLLSPNQKRVLTKVTNRLNSTLRYA